MTSYVVRMGKIMWFIVACLPSLSAKENEMTKTSIVYIELEPRRIYVKLDLKRILLAYGQLQNKTYK